MADMSANLPDINTAVNHTIWCADSAEEPPSIEQAEAIMAEYRQRSAVFETYGLASVSCAGWSVPRDSVPDFGVPRPLPLLIIGGATRAARGIVTVSPHAERLPMSGKHGNELA